MLHTFNKIDGDFATYSLGDGVGAVRMACEAGSIAIDIETMGLGVDAQTIKAVVISGPYHAHVLDPEVDREAIIDAIEYASELVFHNSPFDVPPLVTNGLMRPEHVWKVFDTLVAARMTWPGNESKGLGPSCERALGEGYAVAKRSLADRYRAQTGKSKSQMFKELGLTSDPYVNYAGFDGVMTSRLRSAMFPLFDTYTNDHPYKPRAIDTVRLFEREQIVNRMLLMRSATGIEVDDEALEQLQVEMAEVAYAQTRILAEHGVDVSIESDPLLKKDAVRRLGELGVLPANYPKLKDGTPTADKRHLGKLVHPIIEALDLRSTARRFSTDYAAKVNAIAIEGRIHPQVNVMVARTGRMSIGEPPLQQFPAKVRRMLRFDVPSTSLDWSSIEPVFFANVAGETSMIEAFEAGGDLYMPIAERAGVPRQTAKMVLLAQLYGQGAPSLGLRLGLEDYEAYALVDEIRDAMPNITGAAEKIKAVSEKFGKIQTVAGRIVPQDPDPRTGNNRFYGYVGVNHLVQGSCYDFLAEAMVSMHTAGLDDAFQMAVHDELVVATEAADEVERIMSTPIAEFCEMAGRAPKLRVGRADMGHNWEEKK